MECGKGRPVIIDLITDNSVETIVFGNTEMNNDSLDAVKSKLSPHRHRGGKGCGYACLLTLGTESCQSMRHQENFFVFF